MSRKIALAALVCLYFAQLAAGSLNEVVASKSGQPQQPSKASETAQPRQYKLGEVIRVKEGLTLKVVPGRPKSIELFASKVGVEERSLVFDLEFSGGEPADGYVLFLELSEYADKSDAVLRVAGETIAPRGFGLIEGVRVPEGQPRVLNIVDMTLVDRTTGKRLAMLPGLKGKKVISLLFGLKGKQLEQEKKLVLSFSMGKNETYSFVFDLR